jgi:uncharacterized protein
METRLGAPGDFAQAYVIAHEFGHHIQLVVGVAGQVLQSQQARPDLAAALSVRMELQADCLAGVWGYSAYTQEQLEPGDLEEAVTAAAAVGDDRLQRLAGRAVNPDSFTHGTSEQRVAWFLEGFRYGQPERCDTFSRADPEALLIEQAASARRGSGRAAGWRGRPGAGSRRWSARA